MKQVIVMRTDLKMGKGKIAAQACHACLANYKKSDRRKIEEWENTNQKKIVLKISGEEELLKLYHIVKSNGLVCSLITDAGYTQIEPNTKTCFAIGPDDDEEIDRLTGHLKLL